MTKWRKWIVYKGIPWVAERVPCHKETVRGWVSDKKNPKDKHKERLVELSGGEFGIIDFYNKK